jgi:hypothetical protein
MRVPALILAGLSTIGLSIALASPAQAASAIQFGRIQYDPSGADTHSNTQINREYVVIKNLGTTSKSLKGWTVRDNQSHVYTFGTLTLGAGRSVTLHTGKGTNTTTNRYWGLGWYVWNNTGDKATLRNASSGTLDTCSWTSDHGSTNC